MPCRSKQCDQNGGVFMDELRSLAIPFGILLTQYSVNMLMKKKNLLGKSNKKSKSARGQKGGECGACGTIITGGRNNIDQQREQLHNQFVQVMSEFRDMVERKK